MIYAGLHNLRGGGPYKITVPSVKEQLIAEQKECKRYNEKNSTDLTVRAYFELMAKEREARRIVEWEEYYNPKPSCGFLKALWNWLL